MFDQYNSTIKMENRLQIFGGKGFVGSEFINQYKDCIVNDRNDYEVKSSNILYLISTVTNYNVLTDPYVDIETNLITLMKVLSQCQNKNVIFNFVSSWFVYGNTDLPAKEDSICKPTGFYSITKKTAEDLLISYSRIFNINYRILRLANVIGKGDSKASSKKNALQYLINQLKKHEPIQLYNNGQMYRDYIHVSDAAKAINLIVSTGDLNTVYNVGNGRPVKFCEIIDYAVTKTKSRSIITSVQPPDFHKVVQVDSMYMDTKKLTRLGYSPKLSIQQAVDDMI